VNRDGLEPLSVIRLWEFDPLPPLVVIGREVESRDGHYRSQTPLSEFPSLGGLRTSPSIGLFDHQVGRLGPNRSYAYNTHVVGMAFRLDENVAVMNDDAAHFITSLRDGPSSGYPEGQLLYIWEERASQPIEEAELRDFDDVLSVCIGHFPRLSRRAP
jgi:hypothetical protein